MILEGRHKFALLTREIPRPPPGDPQERFWKGEESLIRATLINMMEPHIGKSDTLQLLKIFGTQLRNFISNIKMSLAYVL